MGKQILKINGVFIQDPSSLQVQLYDLDSEDGSGRNQAGDMLRDRKAVKRKVVCKFPPMYDNEISELLQAVQDEFFTLEYPDPHTGGRRTSTFYVGDRTMPMYSLDEKTNVSLWKELNMNFIER